ncbi:hypothetical protein HD554DRAFT_2331643 [Boletus coccyginus]|nr:hypothetical protein HD554DRAFT_2331643 [Boletus coccyginus]
MFHSPSCPLGDKITQLERTNQELRVQLANAQHQADGLIRINRAHEQKYQCESLYTQGRIQAAAECLLEIVNTVNEDVRVNKFIMDWLAEFIPRCIMALERVGDEALNAGKCDEAAASYSTALSLGPTTPNAITMKWVNMILRNGSAHEALSAATKFKIPRVVVYRAICDILQRDGRLPEAVECFRLMLNELPVWKRKFAPPEKNAKRTRSQKKVGKGKIGTLPIRMATAEHMGTRKSSTIRIRFYLRTEGGTKTCIPEVVGCPLVWIRKVLIRDYVLGAPIDTSGESWGHPPPGPRKHQYGLPRGSPDSRSWREDKGSNVVAQNGYTLPRSLHPEPTRYIRNRRPSPPRRGPGVAEDLRLVVKRVWDENGAYPGAGLGGAGYSPPRQGMGVREGIRAWTTAFVCDDNVDGGDSRERRKMRGSQGKVGETTRVCVESIGWGMTGTNVDDGDRVPGAGGRGSAKGDARIDRSA